MRLQIFSFALQSMQQAGRSRRGGGLGGRQRPRGIAGGDTLYQIRELEQSTFRYCVNAVLLSCNIFSDDLCIFCMLQGRSIITEPE